MADRNSATIAQAQPRYPLQDRASPTFRDDAASLSGPRVMFATSAKAGESLIGLLVRAARLNHLPRLRPLLGACTPAEHAELYLATREDIDFDRLAFAARLTRSDVESRRYSSMMLSANLPVCCSMAPTFLPMISTYGLDG